jgi:hypothetical protein
VNGYHCKETTYSCVCPVSTPKPQQHLVGAQYSQRNPTTADRGGRQRSSTNPRESIIAMSPDRPVTQIETDKEVAATLRAAAVPKPTKPGP